MNILKKYQKKFQYAFLGILTAVKTEVSLRIHLLITVLVIGWGLVIKLPAWKWVVLLLTIGLVLVTEMLNTAIERTVDLFCESYHPKAKQAKDIAAGAVLLAACIAVAIGLVIFFC